MARRLANSPKVDWYRRTPKYRARLRERLAKLAADYSAAFEVYAAMRDHGRAERFRNVAMTLAALAEGDAAALATLGKTSRPSVTAPVLTAALRRPLAAAELRRAVVADLHDSKPANEIAEGLIVRLKIDGATTLYEIASALPEGWDHEDGEIAGVVEVVRKTVAKSLARKGGAGGVTGRARRIVIGVLRRLGHPSAGAVFDAARKSRRRK